MITEYFFKGHLLVQIKPYLGTSDVGVGMVVYNVYESSECALALIMLLRVKAALI